MEFIDSGVGWSENKNAYKAGIEAVKNALSNKKTPNLLVVFSTIHYEGKFKRLLEGIFHGLRSSNLFNKEVKLIGGTGDSVIADDNLLTKGVAVMALSSSHIRVGLGKGENFAKNPFKEAEKATREAFDSIKERPEIRYLAQMKRPLSKILRLEPYSLLILPAVYGEKINGQNYSDLATDMSLDGAKSAVGRSVPIVGGVLMDETTGNKAYKRSYLFINKEVYKNSFGCCAFSTDLVNGFGVAHGFKPTGKAGIITKAYRNFLFQLDGRPAKEVLMEWFEINEEDWKKSLSILYAVKKKYMVATPDIEGNYWCNHPTKPLSMLSVPKSAIFHLFKLFKFKLGEMIKEDPVFFVSKLTEGSVLSLLEGSEKSIVNAGKETAKDALNYARNPKNVGAAFLFSCGQRHLMLKEKVVEEIRNFRKVVKAPTIGFYTGGEIGLRRNTQPFIGNMTLTSYIMADQLISEI